MTLSLHSSYLPPAVTAIQAAGSMWQSLERTAWQDELSLLNPNPAGLLTPDT